MASDKTNRVTICSATFGPGQGYIVPQLLKAISVRSRPALIILAKMLYSDNLTPDQKFLHRSYVYGDEIDLQWSKNIPEESRNLCLSYDLKELKQKITRILKKDQASLFIVQNRPENGPDKFDGEGSSDNFTIFVGRGTNDREGLQSVPALRVRYQQSAVVEPADGVKLKIPVKTFRDMMGSFGKCKQDDQIKITFFDANEAEGRASGILITSRSNLNNGSIIEKFGDIPEESGASSGPTPILNVVSTPVDEKSIVRSNCKVQLVLVDPGAIAIQPNEFISDPDKVGHFVNFASLSNEGTIRIYYTPGADLKFSFRFGPYGEQYVYINNGSGYPTIPNMPQVTGN